jgi:superfamily I DNA/RNA helicase
MNLTTSYRLTRPIADFVNKVMLGSDGAVSSDVDGRSSLVERIHAVKDGPKVSYIRRSTCFQVFRTIGVKIINMILSGYAKPSDIFVLAASVKQKYFKMIENMLVENNIP